jgi:hypothetical protein
MSNLSTSVASGHCGESFVMRRSVRPYLTSGVALTSAGILAAGLVAAPPEVSVAQNEVRGVQLIALALSSTAPSAAILEKFVRSYGQTGVPVSPVVVGGADITGAVVTSQVKLVRAVQPTGSPTQAVDATAQLVIEPAMESEPVTNAALAADPNPSASSPSTIVDIVRGTIGAIALLGVLAVFGVLFFVVAPVYDPIASGINAILGALGLPTLPTIVPDFSQATATPEPPATDPPLSSSFAAKADATARPTDTARIDAVSSDPVAPQTHKSDSSAGTARSNRPLSDPVAPDTDTPKTSKPLMNVAKDSPNFAPKPRGRDSSSPNSDLVRTQVETTTDNATTVDQHPVGGFGKKPKPGAANGEQKPGGDQSSKRSSSQ